VPFPIPIPQKLTNKAGTDNLPKDHHVKDWVLSYVYPKFLLHVQELS
jgi:hypothetical protein